MEAFLVSLSTVAIAEMGDRTQRVKGKANEATGRAKEAAGDLTNDRDLKNEGKLDQVKSTVKDITVSEVKRLDEVIARDCAQ